MPTTEIAIHPGVEHQPLTAFARLYDAQLRSERKSPNTIAAYNYALERFGRWFERDQQRAPLLADFTAIQVRLFLADAGGRPKFEDHPLVATDLTRRVSGATLHQYARSLKTFCAWLEPKVMSSNIPCSSCACRRGSSASSSR